MFCLGETATARRAAMVSTPLVAPTPSAPLPELVVPRRHAPVWTRLAAAVLVAAVALGVVASTSHHSAPNLAATAALPSRVRRDKFMMASPYRSFRL